MRNIIEAVEAIKTANSLIILMSAGMEIDSGLPDFCGNKM